LQSRRYLFLGLVLFLTVLAGVLYRVKDYHLGLDVKGGVRITYQMTNIPKGQSLEDVRTRTYNILYNRASGTLGATDAVVQPKGEDQFVIELPGFKDVDAASAAMANTARILLYDARNVVTRTAGYREYEEVSDTSKPGAPVVNFKRRADGKLITPKDPEYKQVIAGWELIAGGDDLVRADMVDSPGHDGYIPSMAFSSNGAQKMERWSRANNHRGEMLAAVLDNRCISIAGIMDNAVLSDNAVIQGTFSTEYVRNLRDLLNAGALPVDLQALSTEHIDPSIGRHALDQIVTAGAVSAAVIAAFMLVYYVFPGFIAVIALALYILFTLTALKLIEATFSLAAIAGFVLSVGMAVDANILVFERLKEELRSGKTLAQAIELGFRRALPAIIDSNACTVLTAFVLASIGTGPVKGFATTLIIGVAISLFTAVMVTRSLLVFFVGSGIGANEKWYGLSRQWFGEGLEKGAHKKPLQIVNKAGRYFLISALTIVPGVIFLAMGGLKGNVEFTGGTEAVYSATGQNVSASQIVANLERGGVKGANATIAQTGNDRLVYVTVPESKELSGTNKETRERIAQIAGLNATPDRGINRIGATIQKETLRNAIMGVIASSVLIILYLAIRFGFALGGFVIGFRFSVSTILALLHDILVVIGLAAITGFLLGWQVSALFISAMLTVIGFSTHDTIVIFDRIRENLRKPLPGEDASELINRSITQSIARSINTSMTVIVTLAILIGIGSATPDLKLFNAAMLIGIVSGTYSSIFNASPILYLWDKAIGKKRPGSTLLGIAEQNKVRVKLTTQAPEPTPTATAAAAGATQYGQVKRRRASDVERSKRMLDDE
jgi:SecD/SecF fusion protein